MKPRGRNWKRAEDTLNKMKKSYEHYLIFLGSKSMNIIFANKYRFIVYDNEHNKPHEYTYDIRYTLYKSLTRNLVYDGYSDQNPINWMTGEVEDGPIDIRGYLSPSDFDGDTL